MPKTKALTAMSTVLYKFLKQQKLVQICNIIDDYPNQLQTFGANWAQLNDSGRKDVRLDSLEALIQSNDEKAPSKDSLLIQSLFFKALWADNEVITKKYFAEIIDKLDKTLAIKYVIEYLLNSISQCFFQCPEPFTDKIINAFLDAGDYKKLIEYYNVMANHAGDHYILSEQIKYAYLAYSLVTDEEVMYNLEENFLETKTNKRTSSFADLQKKIFYDTLYNLCVSLQEFNAQHALIYLPTIIDICTPEQYNELKSLKLLIEKNITIEQDNLNLLNSSSNIKVQEREFTLNCSKAMSELLQGIKLQLKKNNDLKILTDTCLKLIETAMQTSPELQEEQSMLLYHYIAIFNNHKENKEEVITAISKMLLLQEAVPEHLQHSYSLNSLLIHDTITIIIDNDFLSGNFNFSASVLNLFLNSNKLSSSMLDMFRVMMESCVWR
jgi:hypothetical protein